MHLGGEQSGTGSSANVTSRPVLILGGGIAGMTAAVEIAEVGYPVILIEKEAYLGGRVVRMHRYFPKMCPPGCGMEINVRRIRRNPRITVHTLATVEELTTAGDGVRAKIRIRPRYVTGGAATDDATLEKWSRERVDEFNYGIGETAALYLPFPNAYPPVHVLDRDATSDRDVLLLERAQSLGMIDLEQADRTIEVDAGAVIVATGWRPYDAGKIEHLGFGRYPNVLTNVMMERLADPDGPTGGNLVRPSDGRPATNVAFVQCAGSRDEDHLPYCSAVCCMASLKQVRYLREKNEGSRATVFYIDIRTPGRFEKFYDGLLDDPGVSFVKGKVAEVRGTGEDGDLVLEVEDTIAGKALHPRFDLVVLATGMVPSGAGDGVGDAAGQDEHGFLEATTSLEGVFAAGCVRHPCDVSQATKEGTAAALRAVRHLRRGS